MERHILQLFQEGATSVSNLLLKNYKRMSLTDEEMMLIIHLLSFQQEGNRFPTLDQLEERLSMPSLRLMQVLQKLLRDEWMTIDDSIDPHSGLRSESYNLERLYEKLYQCWKKALLLENEIAATAIPTPSQEGMYQAQDVSGLYNHFEQAFGRPLSPFEVETLQIWIDQDKYPEDLILTALREAVSVGKLYIRYIDRILLEWQRQQISSVEEARNYSLRFRRQSTTRDH